ncbi:hypothetical protein CROQUDRAFT_669563 [Cronartium quercuum f. sp. fusiforme G11]|uniref:DUF221-domain-containing protein n=1 Tax=Cronartium quercuum f. sp. fusiforme G11 TaxID=708437 RepID=A0A9P6NMQ9_9BASI|nr:hypothetical protein CROQUDRAFT_669563 [Cronartium quercuum f. sp. fusiforme G11]
MSASQADAHSTSSQTFLSALILNSVICGVEILAFMLLRRKFRKVYQPRSYLPPRGRRSEGLPSTFFGWIPAIIKADPEQIISKNGLDAYCFLRFLRLMGLIFAPIFVLSWAVLLPVYAAHSGGTKQGLDQFTFGNVGLDATPRFSAPLIMAYVFTFYILYLLQSELKEFLVKRQDFLISKQHSKLAQSRTVLVTGVPQDLLNVEALQKFTSYLPGGARQIWIARDLGKLPEVYDRRAQAFAKLESGETKLLALAQKGKSKPVNTELEKSGADWAKYVDIKKRPQHKLGFFGLWGKKVDTIEWATEEIVESSKELDQLRDKINECPTHNAAFIEFKTQIAAHMFAQSISHHMPLRMTSRFIEVAAADVIWSTLNLDPLQAQLRGMLSWAITIALIVFWSIPVAFVGIVSNVNGLCAQVSWMAWLCKLPTPIPGILQGVLPPVLLAVLFMLLPIVLRKLAIFQGIPLHSRVELSLMSRYFLFLVIHGFLIVTLSSGLTEAIPKIVANPSSAVTILAQELPQASTFFLTYIVTTTLSGAAGSLLQIAGVVVYYLKINWLSSTPRSVYNIRSSMSSVAWGTLFPNITLLTVIGIAYSIVSPILNGFMFVGFALFWFVYKYLFIYVMNLPTAGETAGQFFPLAIKHVFVGLYIGEIFLAALFFFAQDSQGKQAAVAEGALMIVLIILTMIFHRILSSNYLPIMNYLPISLAPRIDSGSPDGTFGEVPLSPPTPVKSEKSNELLIEEAPSRGSGETSHEFDHPSGWELLKPVWLPRDSLGLSTEAISLLSQSKIAASDQGAEMNEKGKVEVTRNPPGENELIEIPPADD